jgi:hypothetical protein
MLYHLQGIDYPGDPYCLWGRRTQPGRKVTGTLMASSTPAI